MKIKLEGNVVIFEDDETISLDEFEKEGDENYEKE